MNTQLLNFFKTLIGVTKIHSFDGSHGSKSAMHHIYEVNTK